MKVFGVRKGYNGLIDGDLIKMNLRSVRDIIHRGGTFLYTARSARFFEKEWVEKAAENCKEHNIDVVVVIGGDGSFNGALELSKLSIPSWLSIFEIIPISFPLFSSKTRLI